MSKILLKKSSYEENLTLFYCPGCKCNHGINKGWNITGTEEKPTISPSVLTTWHETPPDPWPVDKNGKYLLGNDGRIRDTKKIICHLFVRNGEIKYLNDCTHNMVGKTIPMEEP